MNTFVDDFVSPSLTVVHKYLFLIRVRASNTVIGHDYS